MGEILKINCNTEQPMVSARDLHKGLEIKSKYADWFKNMSAYGFLENIDYFTVSKNLENGGRTIEHEISVDMAKQICMIQRSEKGRQYRQYLLDLEKAWNTPEQVFARALRLADKTINNLQVRIEEMQPKVDFFDAVADSKTAISMNEVAKVLAINGYGRNKMFDFLRNEGILDRFNVPYQRYVDCGWFRVIEQKYMVNGEPHINTKTLVYQKGVDAIRKRIMKAKESDCIEK